MDQSKITRFLAISTKGLLVVFLFVLISFSNPALAKAGFLSFISDLFSYNNNNSANTEITLDSSSNSQNLPLLQSTINYDINAAKGGGDISTVGNEALVSEKGPSGTLADIGDSSNTGQITKYIVRSGDTLSSISKMFGVSVNTIVWANDVSSSKKLKEGQVLVILPVSGTIHTVVKGDTLKSIAKKYKADIDEIVQFNNIDKNAVLALGDTIIIPDGEGAIISSPSKSSSVSNPYRGGSGPEYIGYYLRPLFGGVKTQGLHGYNAIDIGTSVGTPILASASGEVIISRSSGWNGGYGEYIVISHLNGSQTLYSHLSEPLVSTGQIVRQGDVIGLSGNTGKSTGPHLHFEVRGAVNPF